MELLALLRSTTPICRVFSGGGLGEKEFKYEMTSSLMIFSPIGGPDRPDRSPVTGSTRAFTDAVLSVLHRCRALAFPTQRSPALAPLVFHRSRV